MAGGIFVDQPYHPNPKCLLFSALVMALYWFSPAKKNKFMLPVIFVVSYVAMAWYDYRYNCDTVMYSGSALGPNTLDSIFKPQRRQDQEVSVSPDQEAEYLKRVYLFHVIAVAPVLMYVGFRGKDTDPKLYPVIMAIGMMALVYHGFRVFNPRQSA